MRFLTTPWARGRRAAAADRRRASPTVTVAVCTLDRRDQLERTLHALRSLTYPAFEVVVVNRPSSDGTAEMLEGFDHSLRVAACGVAAIGASRNIAVASAAGDLVAFIDDDAIPPPNWLETLLPAFDDPLVGAAGGAVFDVPLGRVDWQLCTCTRLGAGNTDSPGPINRYLGAGADPVAYLAGCNMMIRRSALQQVDGFNPLLTGAYDDVDICCRLNDAGWGIAYVPAAVVRHDRAPNLTRDDQQTIRDPYRILASRAIFAMQSTVAPDETAVVAMLAESLREWTVFADQQLAAGHLTPDEHQRFVEQAEAGARDGLAAGRGPRLVTVIPDPPRHLFRPYR